MPVAQLQDKAQKSPLNFFSLDRKTGSFDGGRKMEKTKHKNSQKILDAAFETLGRIAEQNAKKSCRGLFFEPQVPESLRKEGDVKK